MYLYDLYLCTNISRLSPFLQHLYFLLNPICLYTATEFCFFLFQHSQWHMHWYLNSGSRVCRTGSWEMAEAGFFCKEESFTTKEFIAKNTHYRKNVWLKMVAVCCVRYYTINSYVYYLHIQSLTLAVCVNVWRKGTLWNRNGCRVCSFPPAVLGHPADLCPCYFGPSTISKSKKKAEPLPHCSFYTTYFFLCVWIFFFLFWCCFVVFFSLRYYREGGRGSLRSSQRLKDKIIKAVRAVGQRGW